MMKKFFILSFVLLATPAMAAVTITVTDIGNCMAEISYTDTGAPDNVRAFALDVTVDSDANIIDCNGFMVGECNSVVKGYGIFPGRFARYITPTSPNWGDPNYTPVAVPADLPGDTQGGIETGGVTLEMGSLYVDANVPDLGPAVLCRLKVDRTCNMTVTVNAGRGGVVLEDASTVVPVLTGATGVEVVCEAAGCACYGDAYVDGQVNIDDLAAIVGYLGSYSGTSPPYTVPVTAETDCYDVNGDNFISIDDLAAIVGYLGPYSGTSPPYTAPCMPTP